MIKVLIFDLGNVLIYFDWNLAIRNMNEYHKGLGDKINDYFKTNREIITRLEKGKLSPEIFFSEIKKSFNSSIDKDTLFKFFSEIFSKNKILTKKLPKIKKLFPICVLSNTNIIHREYGWKKYTFLKYFDKLFLSYEIGHVKPEKEIYLFVQNSLKVHPYEILYIDDIEDYVDAAKEVGWNAIKFESNEKLFDELKLFNINLT